MITILQLLISTVINILHLNTHTHINIYSDRMYIYILFMCSIINTEISVTISYIRMNPPKFQTGLNCQSAVYTNTFLFNKCGIL